MIASQGTVPKRLLVEVYLYCFDIRKGVNQCWLQDSPVRAKRQLRLTGYPASFLMGPTSMPGNLVDPQEKGLQNWGFVGKNQITWVFV